jgi:hypothetical protein
MTWRQKLGEFFASPFGSMLRVFVFAIGTAAVADWADLMKFDFSDWKIYVQAGLASVGPVLWAYFNGSDPRFGNVENVPDPVSPPTSE